MSLKEFEKKKLNNIAEYWTQFYQGFKHRTSVGKIIATLPIKTTNLISKLTIHC